MKNTFSKKLLGSDSTFTQDTSLILQSAAPQHESAKALYERKMHVGYEAFSKKVSVYFRGERKVLPTLYNSREEGITAGEQYCRDNGWEG